MKKYFFPLKNSVWVNGRKGSGKAFVKESKVNEKIQMSTALPFTPGSLKNLLKN